MHSIRNTMTTGIVGVGTTFVATLAGTATAAPPNESTWIPAVQRMTGTWQWSDAAANDATPFTTISFEWSEPYRRLAGTWHGDGVSGSSEFGWNAKSGKVEGTGSWTDADGRAFLLHGELVDVAPDHDVWTFEVRDEDGRIVERREDTTWYRHANDQFKTVRFFSVDAEPTLPQAVNCTRINPLQQHMPGTDEMIGTWRHTGTDALGRSYVETVETTYGPGHRSIRTIARTAIGDQAPVVDHETTTFVDPATDRLQSYRVYADGTFAVGDTTVETEPGRGHTMTTTWSGFDQSGQSERRTTVAGYDGDRCSMIDRDVQREGVARPSDFDADSRTYDRIAEGRRFAIDDDAIDFDVRVIGDRDQAWDEAPDDSGNGLDAVDFTIGETTVPSRHLVEFEGETPPTSNASIDS